MNEWIVKNLTTLLFFLQVRGKVQNLTRKLFGIIREWFLLKSCQNQSNFYFYSLVILMFNHSNRMHLFRRNILLRILFLSPFFLWELFCTWRDKTHEQSKSFVKCMCYIVHETSTCWDYIRSSMSNEVNIRKLFPMSYRTTEYNLMQWKWKLLLLGRKSKH